MYYEEKIINDILMCRVTPDGVWVQLSIENMNNRLMMQSQRIAELEDALAELHDNQDYPVTDSHPLLVKENQ